MLPLTLRQLRESIDRDVVRDITLRPTTRGFYIEIRLIGDAVYTLIKANIARDGSRPRMFPDPKTALRLMHEQGASAARVELKGWTPAPRRAPQKSKRTEK